MMEEFVFPPVCVLGSTGSVGTQAMNVASQRGIRVLAVCAGKNADMVEKQVREFRIPYCAMQDEGAANALRVALADTDTKVFSGRDGICEMVRTCGAGTVVNAVSGEAGLFSTLATLEAGKRLALANKESLVVAGDIVMRTARDHGAEIFPVDSEHCAISQALRAGVRKEVKKLLLTASGGPFFGYDQERLKTVTLQDTLRHPTWNMGAKITVDSATLMNKGFEIIEAVHLFGVRPEQIEVVVHRESIIHSAVEYIDNSILAQMAVPDMRLCVQNALTDPVRVEAAVPELDLFSAGKMTFFRPDEEVFPLLGLARHAIERGGALPAVVNAANEVAVAAFLREKLSFTGIFEVVMTTAERLSGASGVDALKEILEYDREARDLAKSLVRGEKQ